MFSWIIGSPEELNGWVGEVQSRSWFLGSLRLVGIVDGGRGGHNVLVHGLSQRNHVVLLLQECLLSLSYAAVFSGYSSRPEVQYSLLPIVTQGKEQNYGKCYSLLQICSPIYNRVIEKNHVYIVMRNKATPEGVQSVHTVKRLFSR